MADLDLLLEAERRGLLPADKLALLNEARSRGLIGGGGIQSLKQTPKERTWGEAATDIAASVGKGIGQTLQVPGQLYGLVTGDVETPQTPPKNAEEAKNAALRGVANGVMPGMSGLQGLGKKLEEYSESKKSDVLKAKEEERNRLIQEAESKGLWEQAKAAGAATITDPALLTSFLAEMAPNMIPVGAAARVGRGAVLAGQLARGVGIDAAEIAAQKAGTRAALGTGAVMQGADVGTDTYEEAYKELIAKDVPPEEAKQRALNLARASGLSASAVSLLAQKLPGAKRMESAFAGTKGTAGRAIGAVKTGLGEAYSEAAEEGGGAFGKNLAMREVNPEYDLTKGVGTAAALGAIGGGGIGGVTGILQKQEAPPKPQETPPTPPRTHLNEEDTLQSHPLRNPTGSFTATELGDLSTRVNEYRESEGKHPLKSFSIEDLVDANLDQQTIDTLLASKTGYQGQPVDAAQIQQTAAAKNIDTQSQGFQDFLTRATGTNELSAMTPVQLHAAYTGLSNLNPAETLEEGTNAHNFKKLDYETALGNLNNTLVTNPFVDRASVIAQIKQNNPEADDRQADSILRSALRNGDLALTTTPHFDLVNAVGQVVFSTPNREIADRAAQKENLSVQESSSDSIHLPATTITAEELTGPANSYDLRAGNVLLNSAKTEEEAVKQATRYNQIRNEERRKTEEERLKLLNEVQQDKAEIERMEATGMRGTPEYEAKLAESTAKAEDGMKKVHQLEMRQIDLSAPVAVIPTQVDTAFKPSVANAAVELHKQLAPMLKKYGLESVALKIVDSIRNGEAEGNYAQKVISVALDNEPGTHFGVMRHEVLHALKELGAFTPKEWDILSRQAQTSWVPQYMKNRSTEYKGQQTSLYDAYQDIYKEEKLNAGDITQEEFDNNDPKALEGFDEYIQEEAMAEAFRHWKPQAGFFGNLGYRVKELFNSVRNAFKGLGFQTADSVFKNIEAGKVREGTGELRQKRFSLKTTKPESLEIIEGKSKPDLGKKVTVDNVGVYFDNIVAQEFGGPLDYNNKEAYDRAVGIATKEVEYQLKQVNSGLDWYEEDVKKAFEDTEKVIPELKNESKRQLFTVVAAIMSPQTNARDNWFIAAKAFKHYIDTGIMPGENPDTGGLWQGGTQSVNKKKQLDFLNNMLQQLGEEATIDWITSEHSVRELNEYRRIYGGMGPGVSGKATDTESGFYAFGPKVGPFCSNLNGIYDVTVDKWMTRTFNRYFGRMVDANGKIVDAPTEPQRRVVKNLVNEVAKNANVKNYQVQSLLWFFEQRLFRELGTAAPSYGFSDGGRKVLSELGRAKGNEPSGGAAENAEGKFSLRAKEEVKRKPKERFALALGKIEPDTVVVPDDNDDPNGALGYMPKDRRFGGKPIIMRIGRKEFEEAVDRRGREEKGMRKGYGLNHILYRQEDIDHRPEPITRELAEDILREAKKIATNYTRIFRDPRPDKNPNSLILATPIGKNGKFDTLIVRPGPDGYEIITMFRQTVGKFGGPIFTGRNVQPESPDQYLLKTPIKLPVVAGKTGAEPKPPAAPKKRTLSPEAIAQMQKDLGTRSRYSLKAKGLNEELEDYINEDIPRALDEYAEIDGTKGGKLLDVDLARNLSPEYRADKSLAAQVHEACSTFVQMMYDLRLQNAKPGGIVTFMSGGGGAGKSSAEHILAKDLEASHTIFDSTLSSLDKAKRNIRAALDREQFVIIAHVYREPVDALVNGVFNRAMDPKNGRTVPLEAMVKSHAGSNEVIRELEKEFGDDPLFKIRVIDNSHGWGKFKEIEVKDLPVVSKKGLLEKLRNATDKALADGTINQKVHDATVSGFDTGPAQSQGERGKTPEGNERNVSQDQNAGKPKYSLKAIQKSEALRGIISDETLEEIQDELAKFSDEKPTPKIDSKLLEEAVDLLTPFMEKARSYKGAFDDIVRDIAQRSRGEAKIPGVKGMKRASEKLAGEEFPEKGVMDPSAIQDLLRATVVVPEETDIGTVIREIGEVFPITREKNRFKNPLSTGYRDILLNVMTPVGIKAEIQINIPPMIAAKDTGHILYEMFRAEPKNSERANYLEELSSRLYNSAYLFSQNFKSSGVTSERNMRNLGQGNSLERLLAKTGEPSLSSTTGTPSTSQSLAPAGNLNTTGSKLSLRSQLPASVNARINATTGQRNTEGFVDRILSILKPETRARLRAGFIFQFEALERGTKARAAKYGNREYMADVSATAAALESMRSKNIVAAAMRDGVPVYRNGFTTTDNFNGTQKGLLEIFSPLAQSGDPEVWRYFQFYAGSKRGARLDAEGREHLFTRQDLNDAQAMAARFKQMGIDFDAVYKEYQKWNEALVKYMKDTGVISATDAAYFTKFGDYIPFYRQVDGENTVGPKIFSAIAGVQKPKALKGGTEKLGDFLENVIRNASAAVDSGMKNVAATRGIRDALDLGTARRVAVPNQDSVSVKENGITRHYELDDPLLYEAFKGLNVPRMPWVQILAKPADVLRNFVTKDPGFILANIMRDSVSAWVTSGSNMIPVIDSFKQFGKILANQSPEAAAMARAGLGGYEFKGSLKDSAESFEKALRAKTGTRTASEKALLPLTKLWDMLEQGSNASDMATRAEIYKRVLKETGNEAEALFQASEVMNFSRKGNFAVMQAITAVVPFMNARIQGMDVLYRSGFGKAANANKERMQKAFIVRSLSLLALSAMYWAMVHDDDEYKKLTKEERDGYWIVPGLSFNGKPFRFPIPFEIGVVFKVLPERILELKYGQDTPKDFRESITRNILDTLKFNPIPQAFIPIAENITNHSFFTGEKIVGRGLENVAKPLQYTASTSMGARWLGEQTGMSPIQIENVVRGYTGTMGMYAVNMLDSFFASQGDPVKATTRAEQLPVIKRFFASDSGTVAQYYDLKEEVDEVVRTVNFLSLNNPDKLEGYLKDNENTYMLKDFVSSIEKDMKEIREYRNAVNADTSMSGDEKRAILDELHDYEVTLTSDIKAIRKEYH